MKKNSLSCSFLGCVGAIYIWLCICKLRDDAVHAVCPAWNLLKATRRICPPSGKFKKPISREICRAGFSGYDYKAYA